MIKLCSDIVLYCIGCVADMPSLRDIFGNCAGYSARGRISVVFVTSASDMCHSWKG